MSIVIKIEGLEPGTEGQETIEELVHVFEVCLNAALLKEQQYGGAWRRQGWMGNLARVMSKTSRLRNMLWRTSPLDDHDEPVLDTLHDLINISAFAALNFNAQNQWGRP